MTPTTEIVPLGFCQCGCGGIPKLARRTNTTRGRIKGLPVRFLRGHRKLIPPTVEDAAPFKIDGAYCRLILLTCGQYTIVWESDYRWLMQWKWCASWSEDTKSFYAERRGTGGARIKMHRLILGLRSGDGIRTDHRNHLTLDNRRENLIGATPTESQRNRMKPKNNTSGYKGVSWCKKLKKWRAYITYDGKWHHLGYFDTKDKAYAAYCRAALKHFGEFAQLA